MLKDEKLVELGQRAAAVAGWEWPETGDIGAMILLSGVWQKVYLSPGQRQKMSYTSQRCIPDLGHWTGIAWAQEVMLRAWGTPNFGLYHDSDCDYPWIVSVEVTRGSRTVVAIGQTRAEAIVVALEKAPVAGGEA